ncbi:MAG: hypothetical protein ABI811_18595 [Acidobacteriota bacterium]
MKLLLPLVTVLCAGLASAQSLTNDDLIKLSKAGLSEQFVTDLIDQQGTKLSSDVSSLILLKQSGVNERILDAVVRRTSSGEGLNTDSVLRLVHADFSDGFIIDLLNRRPGQFSTNAGRIIELKQAGVSERLLALMVNQGSSTELPRGTEISVRLIDAIDSETNLVGDVFRASLHEPIVVGNEVLAQKGSDATVKLVNAQDSGRLKGRTSLTLQLVSLVIDGKTVTLDTSDVAQSSGSRGERTAKSAAAVGVLGAIIGGIAGGGKGAAVGAVAGAGAGAGAQVLLDPQKVKVPSETVLTFLTDKPTRI